MQISPEEQTKIVKSLMIRLLLVLLAAFLSVALLLFGILVLTGKLYFPGILGILAYLAAIILALFLLWRAGQGFSRASEEHSAK
ncbi:MAG: hypothetical protein HYV77_00635 [Candidatus Wildermuthbacteria bacterium]|nr:hypothetical protein [Candidatus Wildermuthbacteria bacterium]